MIKRPSRSLERHWLLFGLHRRGAPWRRPEEFDEHLQRVVGLRRGAPSSISTGWPVPRAVKKLVIDQIEGGVPVRPRSCSGAGFAHVQDGMPYSRFLQRVQEDAVEHHPGRGLETGTRRSSPTVVWQSGSSREMRRTPSMVSGADRRSLSSPVEIGRTSGSNSRSAADSPCTWVARSEPASAR